MVDITDINEVWLALEAERAELKKLVEKFNKLEETIFNGKKEENDGKHTTT